MSISNSPISSSQGSQITSSLEKLASSNRSIAIATLVAAIVGARGKPTSIKEVLEISQNISFAMYPMTGHGAYIEWERTKETALGKIYG
jgi:hypothetical protein